MTAVYTFRDPHYEITCARCRYGHRSECVKEFPAEIVRYYDGAKRCACLRCSL